jgi:hypothetical protein
MVTDRSETVQLGDDVGCVVMRLTGDLGGR